MPYHIGIASETLNITKFTKGVLKQLDEGKNEFDGKFEAKEITNKLSNPFSSPHQFCGVGVSISWSRMSMLVINPAGLSGRKNWKIC